MAKVYKLPFLESHRQTFELIRDGRKRLETRAGSEEYLGIRPADSIEFSCGTDTFRKEIFQIKKFDSIESLLASYRPEELNPGWDSVDEAERAFLSFPGYEKRIRDYGLLVFELRTGPSSLEKDSLYEYQ